jgi:hypothetical protein
VLRLGGPILPPHWRELTGLTRTASLLPSFPLSRPVGAERMLGCWCQLCQRDDKQYRTRSSPQPVSPVFTSRVFCSLLHSSLA